MKIIIRSENFIIVIYFIFFNYKVYKMTCLPGHVISFMSQEEET